MGNRHLRRLIVSIIVTVIMLTMLPENTAYSAEKYITGIELLERIVDNISESGKKAGGYTLSTNNGTVKINGKKIKEKTIKKYTSKYKLSEKEAA